MPEGFSSIADLKVIVDANTEKFHSGIQGVQGLVRTLGSDSQGTFGTIDNLLKFVGEASLTASGKFKVMAAGLETGIALYQQFAAEGRKTAEQLGVTAEYDRLKSTLDDLGLQIKDGVVGAFFAMQGAAEDTASSLLGFASNTDTAEAASSNFAATLIDRVTGALDRARLSLRLMNAEMAKSGGDIDKTVGMVDVRIAQLRQQLAAAESQNAGPREVTVFTRGGMTSRIDDPVRDLQAEIARLEGERSRLSTIKSALPGQDWIDGTTVSRNLLNAESDALDRQIETLGMSNAKKAEYLAVQKAIGDAERQGLRLTEDQLASIRAEAAEIGIKTQAIDDYVQMQRDAEKAARAAEQAEGIRNTALSEQARMAAEAMKEQLKTVNEVGASMSQNLMQQFRKFTETGKLDFKDFAGSVLSDMAQIFFKNSVMQPLFGAANGQDGGGLITQALGSIFGGFREQGGPVDAGRAYVVGEKRPELFIPDRAGRIAPDTAGASGGDIHVYVHASPEFDAKIESTAQGVVARSAPSIVGASVDATRRNMAGLMTETNRRKT